MSTDPIPDVIEDPNSRDVLAVITRAVFQAGVRWAQIAENWDAYEGAFEQFEPDRVAAFDDVDVERILAHPGILRMRRKVQATIANARALRDVIAEYGSFAQYTESFSDYATIERDMRKRFSHLGEMNVWYVLFRNSRPVPRFEPWLETIKGDHPRMREMVDRARAQGRAHEY